MSAHENEKEETQAPTPDAEKEFNEAGEQTLPDIESRTEPALARSDAESGQSEAEAAGNISGDEWPPGGLDLVLKFLPLPEGLPPGQREVWVGVRPARAPLAAILFRLFHLEELEPLPERLLALTRECITQAVAREVKPEGAGEKAASRKAEEIASNKDNQAGAGIPGQALNSQAKAGPPERGVPPENDQGGQAIRQLSLF
ncbi:MAG TPA: hypothetical protein VH186_23300 [Chloroflexia bacterium]|nr:hypothetical protein [Chloroflexia bacterium]